jgi:hypothetical protein
MFSGDIDQPESTLLFLPPNGPDDRAALYIAARSPILGIANPDFCGARLPPGQLVESAFLIRDEIWLSTDHIPDFSVILTHIFANEFIADEAMTGRVRAGLLDEDAQDIEEVSDSVLAGVFASDNLLSFSPQQAFAQVTVWPAMADPIEFYDGKMSKAIPDDEPLPDGLGLHCGYVSGGQLISFEVWQSQGAYEDLMRLSDQSGLQVIEATCLGLYVADEVRFT